MERMYKLLLGIISIAVLPLTSKGQCLSLPEPLFLQAPDSICAEKKDLIIKTSQIKAAGVKYLWRTPVKDTMTTDSILRISSPTARYSGDYFVAVMIDTCKTKFLGPINIQVVGAPKASGTTITTVVTCNSTEIPITSTYKTNASLFGEWVGTEGLVFDNPKSPSTLVKGLKEGENYAIWILSTTVCPSFIKDTFLIRREVKPKLDDSGVELRAGQSSATIHLGTISGSNLNILKDVEITIIKQPKHGTIEKLSDGKRMKYSRNSEFSGRDVFSLQVCNLKCPNLCSGTINYSIDIAFDPLYPNVGIPKILTPHTEGEARFFSIENIEKYPKNELSIMNRFGNTVVKLTDYSKSTAWDGVGKNGYLPQGAYYYLFQADDKDGKPLKPLTGIFYIVD